MQEAEPHQIAALTVHVVEARCALDFLRTAVPVIALLEVPRS